MRIKLKKTKEEWSVLAITWPSRTSKIKTIPGIQTQFSGYHGNGLEELVRSDFDIIDASLDNFVYPEWPDDRFNMIVWKPLANLKLWQSVREYDPEAINKLRELVKNMPEINAP